MPNILNLLSCLCGMTALPNRVFNPYRTSLAYFPFAVNHAARPHPSANTQHYTHSDKPCTRDFRFLLKNVRRFLKLSPGMPIIAYNKEVFHLIRT